MNMFFLFTQTAFLDALYGERTKVRASLAESVNWTKPKNNSQFTGSV
jgi:hypothetical protein